MAEMKVYIPDDIAHHIPELQFFVDLMVRKLHVNRHKGFAENLDIPKAMTALSMEFSELYAARLNGDQFEFAVEAADVANSAFIAALVALRLTKPDYKASSKDTMDPCLAGHITKGGICVNCGWQNPETR